jgi:hypothetical protein
VATNPDAKNYEAFRQGCRTLIAALSDQPPEAIYWDNEGRPIADPAIALSVVSVAELMVRAECEIVEVEETTHEIETIQIAKELVLQVRFEGVSQTDGAGCLQLCELIRTRSMFGTYMRLASDLGLTIPDDRKEIVNVSYDGDDYKIHARAFELPLRMIFTDSVTDSNPEWFDKIGFSLGIQDEFETPETEVKAP